MIQNHCVSIKQATVLFFSSFLLAACGEPQPRTSVREKGRLTVVMDEPLPGYFVFGGESYGYQYDLFKAYADHLGVELQVVRSERPSEYDAMLADGRADIVTALSDHAAEIAADPAQRMRWQTSAGVDPEIAPFVLRTIRQDYGSAESYLEAEYGLTPARLMRLRRMYLE